MSTYSDRRQQLADLHAAADQAHGVGTRTWQDARRAAALVVLLDAAGHPVTDPLHVLIPGDQQVADLLDRLDTADQRTLLWLAETDAETVAGVAALLDHART